MSKHNPFKTIDEAHKAAQKMNLNTSDTIRALDRLGYSRGQISKVTGKIYQHVRNVLVTPVNKPIPELAPKPNRSKTTKKKAVTEQPTVETPEQNSTEVSEQLPVA